MDFKETSDALTYSNKNVLVFFGKKVCSAEQLKKLYPHFQFRSIHQTHSDKCIHSFVGSEKSEADAHWTQEKNVALVIRSADCLPIFAFDKTAHTIVAIHAGWRGVANRITPQSLQKLKKYDLFIGPHILQDSFEVKDDTKQMIARSVSSLREEKYIKYKNEKMYMDLETVVRHQLENDLIGAVFSSGVDTKTNSEFHSYRRDQKNAGRNLSFICLLT